MSEHPLSDEISSIEATLSRILAELRPEDTPEGMGLLHLAYPNDGTKANVVAGVTDLDYDAGTVIATDGSVTMMSSSLRKHSKRHMQNVAVKASQDTILQFDGEDKFPVDADEWFMVDDYEFKRLRITTTGAANLIVLASSGE